MAEQRDNLPSNRDLRIVNESLSMAFVESYVKRMSISSGDNHVSKGYKYFDEGFLHEMKVVQTTEGCVIKARCYRSQKKNEAPHSLWVELVEQPNFDVSDAKCNCAIGKGKACGHVAGLLYQIAHYKTLKAKVIPEDVAKTSVPQTWHRPRGQKIVGAEVQQLKVIGYSDSSKQTAGLSSTLYNPVRGDFPDFENLKMSLTDVAPTMMIIPALANTKAAPVVETKFGSFAKGSILGVQQKMHSDYILNIYDDFVFPELPVTNSMINNYHTCLTQEKEVALEDLHVSLENVHRFEESTRLQSETRLWHQLRENRVTASKIHSVFVRKTKSEISLVKDLKSKSVTTQAMRDGLADEPEAAKAYSVKKAGQVNVYPCGIVVSPWAPWLAVSPDRKVYDPTKSPNVGLLEIKCPRGSSVSECKYLKDTPTGKQLRQSHQYYTQIQAQLAVTGLTWCDFFVWCSDDPHLETIEFDPQFWQRVKDTVDKFYFEYFI